MNFINFNIDKLQKYIQKISKCIKKHTVSYDGIGKIGFNIGEKNKLKEYIRQIIKCNHEKKQPSYELLCNIEWCIEFVIKINPDVIELLSDRTFIPIVISRIIYEYSHDIIVIDFDVNWCNLEFFIKNQDQFELLIAIQPDHIDTFLLYISDDIIKYNICKRVSKFDPYKQNAKVKYYSELKCNNHTQITDFAAICKFDKFMNKYMKQFYNTKYYIKNTSVIENLCDYNYKCKVFVSSTYSNDEILILEPVNHKLIHRMIIIIKLFRDAIREVLME